MAYVSLYRKYRPQTFAEIVGQGHVTRSLVNAIREDRLHHAYLFTGPRGTGKTSTARILAKSINCVEGPTPEPCNECEQCVAITAGSSVDVIEMDMASHGGVDDARELRDRALFAPASARKKVYILDEVHMASTAAFNALLKLIEEPPSHVVFAMATTDPQKVLPTIMSRVQRLDLRRVGAAEVAGRVRDLAAREGRELDDAAVDAVVRAGDGSLRDTESVLEQVLSYADGPVTGDHVAEVLGQTPFERTAAVVDAVVAGDLVAAFDAVQSLLDAGTDLRQFTLDLVGHVRDLLVLVVAPGRGDLVDATEEARQSLAARAAALDRDVLGGVVDDLATALAEMRQGGPVRLALELALARAALRAAGPTPAGADAAPAATPPSAGRRGGGDGATTADEADEAADAAAIDDGDGANETAAIGPDGQPGDEPDDGDALAPDAAATAGDEAAEEEAVADGSTDAATPEPPQDASREGEVRDGEAREDEEGAGRGVEDPAPDDPAPDEGDLAARAAARAERVSREGLPTPPDDRPRAPEVVVDTPPDRDEAADLAAIRERWEAVLELVKADSRRFHAMLEPATPSRLRNRILTLTFPARNRFHADSTAERDLTDSLVGAVDRACGVRVRLDVHVEGDEPRRPRPRPVENDPGDEGEGQPGPSDPDGGAAATPTAAAGDDGAPVAGDAGGAAASALTATPLAGLPPAEAMDRAAATLAEHLGAREVDPEV